MTGFKIFTPDDFPTERIGKVSVAKITINYNGMFSFSQKAKEILKLSKMSRVFIAQSDDMPEEWYIMNVTAIEEKRGWVLNETTKGVVNFTSRGLAYKMMASLGLNPKDVKSLKIRVASEVNPDFGTGDFKKWHVLLTAGKEVKTH